MPLSADVWSTRITPSSREGVNPPVQQSAFCSIVNNFMLGSVGKQAYVEGVKHWPQEGGSYQFVLMEEQRDEASARAH